MDKIRKIIQIGAYDTENNSWTNDQGSVYVLFEDESIEPVVLPANEAYQVYESLAAEQGKNVEGDLEALRSVVTDAFNDGPAELCDKNNVEELERANAELEAARAKARELGEKNKKSSPVIAPVVPPVTPTPPNDNHTDDEEDYSDEMEDEVNLEKHTGKRVIGALLAGAAGLGAAGAAVYYAANRSENVRDIDDENEIDNEIDFDNATFDQLMESMSEDDARRVAAETAMNLVENLHDATHKENNFRLEEDNATYLDLSFEEALVLTTFANYSEPAELYEVLGSYNITSTQAQETLESARAKLITYYMNAKEPSGLAEMFHSEEDRAFFQNFENEVLAFNATHSTETSDQVIRDVYYNYVLDSATNNTNVSSMAKLLAFDAVYGGLNLVESASVEHTQYLEFHGMGSEAETKYYIENVLKLDYSSLSEEQIKEYRENIIESGTQLVKLMSTGETITEDNSTKEENTAEVSITNLVDNLGLCNSVNNELKEKVQALDTMEATKETSKDLKITTINNSISGALREAGLDELADKVDASIDTELSNQLLEEIRGANKKAAETVENYENKIAVINDENRPSIEQIINAANKYTALLENYAGSSKDIATLINNRRHITEYHYEADENGYIGKSEEGLPIYEESIFDDMTKEEKEEFIKENGEVIDESSSSIKEEVSYDDLTPAEKEEVDEQKAKIEAEIAIENAKAKGQIVANSDANSSFYTFSPSTVTNSLNGEVYDLNSMTFANGVAYAYAFGGNVPSSEDSQIQNAAEVAAENYLDSISESDKEAIANGMGTNWEGARAQLKESYKAGYMSQMKAEIAEAIKSGEEMKRVTEEAKKATEEANKNQESTPATDENKTAEDENHAAPEEEIETPSDEIVEGEEEIEPTPVAPENGNDEAEAAPSEPEVDTPVVEETNPAPAEEEEYDPNIGEQFQEGEVLIEDANGNKVEQSNDDIVLPVEPAPTVEIENANDDIKAQVEAAYYAQLAAEAAQAEAEVSEVKGYSR